MQKSSSLSMNSRAALKRKKPTPEWDSIAFVSVNVCVCALLVYHMIIMGATF
jgi:hypothetical protein